MYFLSLLTQFYCVLMHPFFLEFGRRNCSFVFRKYDFRYISQYSNNHELFKIKRLYFSLNSSKLYNKPLKHVFKEIIIDANKKYKILDLNQNTNPNINFQHNKPNFLSIQNTFTFQYYGQKHKEFINMIVNDINEYSQKWINKIKTNDLDMHKNPNDYLRFMKFEIDKKRSEVLIYCLFGISGSGKSRGLDEIGNKFSDEGHFVIPISFNSDVQFQATYLHENNINLILSEFLIRLLFGIFDRQRHNLWFQDFKDEYLSILIDSFINIDNYALCWYEIILVLEECKIISKDQRIVLLMDELMFTSVNKNSINLLLCDCLKHLLYFPDRILSVWTTLEMNNMYSLLSPTGSIKIKPYAIPIFNTNEIDNVIKIIHNKELNVLCEKKIDEIVKEKKQKGEIVDRKEIGKSIISLQLFYNENKFYEFLLKIYFNSLRLFFKLIKLYYFNKELSFEEMRKVCWEQKAPRPMTDTLLNYVLIILNTILVKRLMIILYLDTFTKELSFNHHIYKQ